MKLIIDLLKLIKILLSFGACKSLKDYDGKDSVELALERKEIRIMKMLISELN